MISSITGGGIDAQFVWNPDTAELAHSFYPRQDFSEGQHLVPSFVSDEAAVFRSGVFHLEDPFVAQLELETFLERFLLIPPPSNRIGERDFVLVIVEVQRLVDRVGKTVQAH